MNFSDIPILGYFSIGLHPWYLNAETAAIEFSKIEQLCIKKNVLAIGECGLDKICKTDWKLQLDFFARQIRLANSINKPLIIHCVRAFEEVLTILEENNVSVPVIFHGFNKNQNLAAKILSNGYYLSFGKHLFNEEYAAIFKVIPLDKVFFETDDAPIKIEVVYNKAAELRQVEITKLNEQITRNIKHVFGNEISKFND